VKSATSRFALLPLVVLFAVNVSHAQWVAVARAVSGRIQQMQQQSADGKGGYDVATVVIEAPAQKVYETALQRLQAHSEKVKVIKKDDKKREVAFTNGIQTASLQANFLGDKLTPSATSMVVQSIQNVCTELKVQCTLQTD